MKFWTAAVILCVISGAGYYVMASAVKTANDTAVARLESEMQRIVDCRAKLANWLMRFEELAKPEKERWESFYEYMGRSCVK